MADHCDAWRSDSFTHGLGLQVRIGELAGLPRLLLGAPCGWVAEPDYCDNGIYALTAGEDPRVLTPDDLTWWDREGSTTGFGVVFEFVGDVTADGATIATMSRDGIYLLTDVPTPKTQVNEAQRPALPFTEPWAAGAVPYPCGDVDGDGLTDLCTTQSRHRIFTGPIPREQSETWSLGIPPWADLSLPGAVSDAVAGQFGVQRSLVFGMHTLDEFRGGITTTPIPLAAGPLELTDVRWQGAEGNAAHGFALAVGDADGDGDDDLVMSSGLPDRRGMVTVLGDGEDDDFGVVLVEVEGEHPYRGFGYATLLQDLDGDGHAELIVSAPNPNAEHASGEVYIFPGPIAETTLDHAIRWRAYSPYQNDFGTSLAAADLDGDGLPELYVGAPGDSFAIFTGGAVFRITDPMRTQSP